MSATGGATAVEDGPVDVGKKLDEAEEWRSVDGRAGGEEFVPSVVLNDGESGLGAVGLDAQIEGRLVLGVLGVDGVHAQQELDGAA